MELEMEEPSPSTSTMPISTSSSKTIYTPYTKLPRLISIEYPGIVENAENALETLGGINKISEVYSDQNRRMELRFRPSDVYCKPTCGERHNSISLLIKVKRYRKFSKEKDGTQVMDTYSVKPVGTISTVFKFNNLCDFQYLPVMYNADGSNLDCIYSELLPQGIALSNWLDSPCSLFLPPATFSRMDNPQDYRYRKDPTEGKRKVPQNIICRTREKRTHFAIFQSFKAETVPMKPLKGAISLVRCKLIDSVLYERLKEEFTKRPIWSKNALRVRLKYTKDKLKYLLPTVAYYFPTGPWRNLWVVFGYDPRKDPTAWLYQTFDFRIRQAGGCKTQVEAKRSSSNYILPYKNVPRAKRKTCVIKSFDMDDEEDDKEKNSEGLTDEFYIFRSDSIPPYRQMFYQFCDIHLPEVQKLLETAILSGANQVCSEKYGWLPAGVEVKCRDILSLIIEKNINEKMSQGSSMKEELRSNSEDDSNLGENSNEDEI